MKYKLNLDFWLFIRYNLTTGKYPFDGDTVFLLFEDIAKGEFTIPEDLDAKLASLLRKMLHVNPKLRISIHGIRRHE